MKLLVITTLFNRPTITEIFLAGMRRINWPVLAAVSTRGDIELCAQANIPYHIIQNQPLGNKWNQIATTALKAFNWTHLMISGDDNLYHSALKAHIKPEADYQGLHQIYFIEPRTERAQLMEYKYEVPVTIGTGRILSRKAVESCVKDGIVNICRSSQTRELDHMQDMILLEHGYMPTIIDPYPMCLDIKHSRNMWTYDNFSHQSEPVDYDDAISWLGIQEKELLHKLVM